MVLNLRDGAALVAVVTTFIAWGAEVPKQLQPGSMRALLSVTARILRPLLDATPRMSKQERDKAQAE